MSPWPVSLAAGLALTLLSGGLASACSLVHPCAPVYGPPASRPCCAPCFNPCEGAEGLTLPGSFFAGAGGVGPIPSGGYGGGAYYVIGAGRAGDAVSGAAAHAQAHASAAASARISIHGGHAVSHGGHWGGRGGKGH